MHPTNVKGRTEFRIDDKTQRVTLGLAGNFVDEGFAFRYVRKRGLGNNVQWNFLFGRTLFASLFLFSNIALTAEGTSDQKSIQDLLNQAEGALMGNPKPAPEATSVKKKARRREALPPRPVVARSSPTAPPVPTNPTDSQLTPFDGNGVERVLALDLQAQQKEHDSVYPQSRVFVGLGNPESHTQ